MRKLRQGIDSQETFWDHTITTGQSYPGHTAPACTFSSSICRLITHSMKVAQKSWEVWGSPGWVALVLRGL